MSDLARRPSRRLFLNLVAATAAVACQCFTIKNYPVGERVCWVAVSVLVAGVLQVMQMLADVATGGGEAVLSAGDQEFGRAGCGRTRCCP